MRQVHNKSELKVAMEKTIITTNLGVLKMIFLVTS